MRILQRCPEWLPKMFEPWLHDPSKTLLLTHANGLSHLARPRADVSQPLEHDPANLDRAREIASATDPIPVGILYHNPEVPCYEDIRHVGAGAHGRADPHRAGGGIRQGHGVAAGRSGRTRGCVTAREPRHEDGSMDTVARFDEQRLFFSTGRHQGDGLDAVGALALRPALLARYRDLTRLRYDFPVVLVATGPDAGSVRSLTSVVDQVLREVAPRGIEGRAPAAPCAAPRA